MGLEFMQNSHALQISAAEDLEPQESTRAKYKGALKSAEPGSSRRFCYPYLRVGGVCGPGLVGRLRGCLGGSCSLPGLGPPREPRRRGFAMGRRDVAPFQAGKLLALLDQLQELCQGHRGRGCLEGSGSWARPFPTAGRVHSQRAQLPAAGKQTLPSAVGATTVGGDSEHTKPKQKGGSV